jgi:16S rRNA (cytidine1402-2'-O)-methyltransferase
MRSFQFYLVGTPIGNLNDLSSRAIEVLESVDIILAEDTRKTKILLGRFGIHVPVRSYHDHNKERVTPAVIALLREGKSAALVADAGTPLISDPGYYLVRKLIEEGVEITSVPGPCAVVTALVLSGFPPDRFSFFGYVPRKQSEREDVLCEARDSRQTSIFFESPHRLQKTLSAIALLLGDREIAVARELTKLHEEVIRGTAEHCMTYFEEHGVKGEITIVIRGTGKRGGRLKGGTA